MNTRSFRIFAIALATALVCAAGLAAAQVLGAGTGTATWKWSAPTQYTDGTPIASGTVITYNVYTGTGGPGSESSTPTQTGVSTLTATTSGYSAGQNVCGTITAVIGITESAHSNEACKLFPAVPNPPATLTVQ